MEERSREENFREGGGGGDHLSSVPRTKSIQNVTLLPEVALYSSLPGPSSKEARLIQDEQSVGDWGAG